jgi:hypothetical protein
VFDSFISTKSAAQNVLPEMALVAQTCSVLSLL